MELISSATNKHGSASSLSTLYIRHGKAATYYEDLTSELPAGNQPNSSLLSSLAHYHREAAQVFATALEVLPNTPVKPNQKMNFEGPAIEPSVAAGTLAGKLKNSEEDFLQLYGHLLNNNGLPGGVWKQIQQQSERARKVVQKLDRISKTGRERDMRV